MMSVSELEEYLLRDDIEAGERLLTKNAQYRRSIRQIAEDLLFSSFPQYVEDAVQEAEIHTIVRVRRRDFVAALFCKAFKQLGANVVRRRNLSHEITVIPPQILDRARQIGAEQGIDIASGLFCFCQEIDYGDQSVTLLTCDHPLRQAAIELVLEMNRVSGATLDEFYTWHRKVARRKIRDCRRQYVRRSMLALSLDQPVNQPDETDRSLIDLLPAEECDLDSEQEREEKRRQVIRCLQQIDLLFRDQRYMELYQEFYRRKKTQQEIADAWQVALGTVTRRHKEMKQRLRKCVENSQVQIPENNQAQLRRRSQFGYDP
ncbi:sigma-70 family RNA polymerase sigma factor [Pseudanabaenaceae cyanobacterium LEGE 13415]|nr:sigma-70 family RNA polymerase sigma factor [Pseudanabaenaceae cyanobacterium LEGE 13415]